jgi:CRISPR-associated protein Cas2
VAQACQDYGQRAQKSVFECRLDGVQWAILRLRLLGEMNGTEDSLRFYFLDEGVRVEHHGTNEPIDLEGPLLV